MAKNIENKQSRQQEFTKKLFLEKNDAPHDFGAAVHGSAKKLAKQKIEKKGHYLKNFFDPMAKCSQAVKDYVRDHKGVVHAHDDKLADHGHSYAHKKNKFASL